MKQAWLVAAAMVASVGAQAESLRPHTDPLAISEDPDSDSSAPFTLIVINQAAIPERPLQEMLRDLDVILRLAGIRTSVVLCRVAVDLPRPQLCAQPLRPDRMVLQLLPGQPARRLYAVGTSTVRRDSGVASAVLFANLAEAIAKDAGWSWGELLAHLAAHEIGHVLLDSSEHSKNGVMRAVWSAGELLTVRHPQALFDQHQSKKMLSTLTTRRMLAQAQTGNR